jgi:DNA polymerase
MFRRETAAAYLPAERNLTALRDAAVHCEGCELYKHALQTVFSAGPSDARIMLIGEMPGDEEDRDGEPFTGPAGWLLDTALEEAGIQREDVYLTNVVKHFRWEPQGRRRIHKKPAARHIAACKPWLDAELQVIKPLVIVCLGATPAQLFLGRSFRVTRQHGEFFGGVSTPWIMATYHPSAILRAPQRSDRDRLRQLLVSDLSLARDRVDALSAASHHGG